ncbi:MAG: nucleoside triphosphate pyrophosphohydrolase [Acidobacteriota bacterium]
MDEAKRAGRKFSRLVCIMEKLRSEKGCPWDREQDEKTLRNYFLEEVYEAIEALLSGDTDSLTEELGDVLMEVVFLAQIFKENGEFTISSVLDRINRKMVERHPHVFGNKEITRSSEVTKEWQRIKNASKKEKSILNGIPKTSPALHSAYEIGRKCASVGFDWENSNDVFNKIKEEMEELEQAMAQKKSADIIEEAGDLLFALANLFRHLGCNPELALLRANQKFIRRFAYMEEQLRKEGKRPEDTDLNQLDALWNEAKEKVD